MERCANSELLAKHLEEQERLEKAQELQIETFEKNCEGAFEVIGTAVEVIRYEGKLNHISEADVEDYIQDSI